ncbi:MAG: aldehyde dehydrogenase family protein [Amphritea sp.]
MKNYDKLYIDGQWVESTGQEQFSIYCASTEAPLASIPMGSSGDADRAVRAARKAFDGWAATAPQQRAELLVKLHQVLQQRSEEFARTLTAEVGMPLATARSVQVELPLQVLAFYADYARRYQFKEQLVDTAVHREPIGVVACITPWSYPLLQVIAKVAPALAAGCTVVLKPSEEAPQTAFMLARILDEIGLPAGVFNLVTGYGSEVGETLVQHSDVDMVAFTGSTAAGKRIGKVAAATVKRVALGLGGKSAAIILDDADLPSAVAGVLNSCMLNSGQTCIAHTRLLVPESLYTQVAELAVDTLQEMPLIDPFSDSLSNNQGLGPIISEMQRQRVRFLIRKGIEEGAELLAGGVETPEGFSRGYYVQPTIFGRVQPNMSIAHEEIFGPVLSIICYQDDADAIAIANNSIYGLSGAVWSADKERATRVAAQLRTGQVHINAAELNPLAPFGGYKQSGNRRELGRYGFEEYLEYKAVFY